VLNNVVVSVAVQWREHVDELMWCLRVAAAGSLRYVLVYMTRAVVRPTVNVRVQFIARTRCIQSAVTMPEQLVVCLY